MQKIKTFVLVLLAGTFSFTSCMKKETYPDIPQIEFGNFIKLYDTGVYPVRGILSVSFTDGDGNIGLADGDTFAPYNPGGEYYYNMVINYYEKQNGEFVKIDFAIPFSVRIPVLNSSDPGRAIKGVIMDTVPLNPYPQYDTIRFETFLYDRSLNKSNIVTTPPIILRRQ